MVQGRALDDRDLYIGRGAPGLPRSEWCNPFRLSSTMTRGAAVAGFRERLLGDPDLLQRLPLLAGRVLRCHCPPELDCHGDVLTDVFSLLFIPPASEPFGAGACTEPFGAVLSRSQCSFDDGPVYSEASADNGALQQHWASTGGGSGYQVGPAASHHTGWGLSVNSSLVEAPLMGGQCADHAVARPSALGEAAALESQCADRAAEFPGEGGVPAAGSDQRGRDAEDSPEVVGQCPEASDGSSRRPTLWQRGAVDRESLLVDPSAAPASGFLGESVPLVRSHGFINGGVLGARGPSHRDGEPVGVGSCLREPTCRWTGQGDCNNNTMACLLRPLPIHSNVAATASECMRGALLDEHMVFCSAPGPERGTAVTTIAELCATT